MNDQTNAVHAVGAVRRFYRPFLPLFGGLFFCHLGIGASLSTLPFYVQQRLGRSDLAIGVAISAIALAAVVARPVAGRLADRYGYKLVMLCGALLAAAAGAGYFVSQPLEALVAVRIVHGIAEGAVFTAGATWLIKLAPDARRGKIIGLYGISMWLGITIGSLIGVTLLAYGGFSTVWTFCLLAPLLGAALIVSKEKPLQAPAAQRASLFPPTALIPGLSLTMAAAGYAALSTFVVLHMRQKGIQEGILVFNAYGLTYVGVRLVFGHWPDKFGANRVALWSGLIEALGLLLIAAAPNLFVAVLGGLIMGAGFSLLYPSLALIVINHTEKTQHGAALGTFTSFWDFGLVLWGPITGFVASRSDYASIYFLTVACAVIAALLASQQAAQRRLATARSA